MKSIEFVRRHRVDKRLYAVHVAVEVPSHVDMKTSVLEPRPVVDGRWRQLAVWKGNVDEGLNTVEDSGPSPPGHGDQLPICARSK